MKKFNVVFLSLFMLLAAMPMTSVLGGTVDDLRELVGSISLSSYEAGTDPGYIVDQAVVDNLTKAYNDAAAAPEGVSNADAAKLLEALQNAKKAADDAAVVELEDGGYYYFFTAFAGYVTGENADYAWYAPHDTHVGCTHFQEDNSQYIWQVKVIETVDGEKHYSIKNAGNGYYVNRGDDTNQEASINWSEKQTTPQVFKMLNKAGQWNVGNTLDPMPYNPAWNGNIVLYPGGENSGSAWFIRKVPEDIVANLDKPQQKLRDYLETLPADFENYYLTGTEPGYLADEAKYTRFYNAFVDAIEKVEDATSDECVAMLKELQEAKADCDAPESIVPIEDGGYYYIFTGFSAFTDPANGNFAWYAPIDEVNHVGWKAFTEGDNQFIWKLDRQTDDDGNVTYKVYNVGSDTYLTHADAHANSSMLQSSSDESVPQVFIPLNHAGLWAISNVIDYSDPAIPYHQENHQLGAGTAGSIVLWPGKARSPSSWYLKKVPDDVVAHIAESADRDRLIVALGRDSAYAQAAEEGDMPGYVRDATLKDNLLSAVEVGKALVADPNDAHTPEEYKTAGQNIKEACEALKEHVNKVPDGYYRLENRMGVYHFNDNGAYLCQSDSVNLGWKHLNPKSADFVWKVTNLPNGNFTVQNAKTGKYIKSSEGGSVKMSDAEEVEQAFKNVSPNGQFAVYNAADGKGSYSLLGHNNGTGWQGNIEFIGGNVYENQSTCWYLHPIDESAVSEMVANQAQTDLNTALHDKIAEARRFYYANTDFQIGDPLITDASQIYSNNSSDEWGDLANLIDEDFNTHWSSAYDVQKEDSAHYLRFYCEAGLPDTIHIIYASRMNGSVHRLMTYIRLQVSADATSWTTLPWELNYDDLHTPTDWSQVNNQYYSFDIDGLKGWKYVRFVNLASMNQNATPYIFNNHPVMDYSEFRLYPVIAPDPESPSQTASMKGLTAKLVSAVQAGVAEYDGGKGKATQATIDAISKALKDYEVGSTLEGSLQTALDNLNNQTIGEQIGEFTEDAYYSYQEGVEKVNDDIQEKGENISAEQVVAYATELKALNKKFMASMNKPAAGHWYVLKVGSTKETAQGHVLSTGGKHFDLNGNGLRQAFTTEFTSEEVPNNLLMSFVFKEREDGSFDIQNVGTGGFFGPDNDRSTGAQLQLRGESYPVRIVPQGNGIVELVSRNGYYINVNGTTPAKVYFADVNLYPSDEGFAWKIAPVEEYSEELLDLSEKEIPADSYVIITKPYEMSSLPIDNAGNTVKGYEIIGAKTADDSLVTAYNLRAISDEEPIKAGTPVIYKVAAAEGETNALTFVPLLNGEVKLGSDTINGLVGTNDLIVLSEDAACVQGDSLISVKAGNNVEGQRGFIIPSLVSDVDSSEPDAVIYAGHNGLVNAIEQIDANNNNALVNVYSPDGVTVKRNVKPADALEGLAKGVYIVGKKKVLVK